jgi:hypothetical protein
MFDPEFLKPGQSLDDFGPQIYFEMAVTFVIVLASWLAWPKPANISPRSIGSGDTLGHSSPSLRQRISPPMKKIQYSRYGGPEELRLDEVAPSDPSKGQVRVQVRAASVNPNRRSRASPARLPMSSAISVSR